MSRQSLETQAQQIRDEQGTLQNTAIRIGNMFLQLLADATLKSELVDELNTNQTDRALTARQGKVLKDLIDALNTAVVASGGVDEYDPNEEYIPNQNPPIYRVYNNNLYEFIGSVSAKGIAPTNTTYWAPASAGVFSHVQNTDTGLAKGTANEVSAIDLKQLVSNYVEHTPIEISEGALNDGIDWTINGIEHSKGYVILTGTNQIIGPFLNWNGRSKVISFHNPTAGSITVFISPSSSYYTPLKQAGWEIPAGQIMNLYFSKEDTKTLILDSRLLEVTL